MSRREEVLQALLALAGTALPGADVKRNAEKPERIGAGGMVILHDGEPGEPEVIFSPLRYTYSHRIPLEVAAFEANGILPNEAVDILLRDIATAVMADRTLGGLTEWLETEAPDMSVLEEQGVAPGRWAAAALIAVYTTTNPCL